MATPNPIVRSVQEQTLEIPHSVHASGVVAQYAATAALLKLVADAWNDWRVFNATPGKNAMTGILVFGNLAPDVVTLMSQIGNLPSEVTTLTPDGLEELLNEFSLEMNLTSDKAKTVLEKSLALVKDAYVSVMDIIAIIQAAKS